MILLVPSIRNKPMLDHLLYGKSMKSNKKPILTAFILSFVIVWSTLTVLALTWGTMFNWPDYVHINYGFPLVWATHTLDTIAGPVDIWNVNLQALIIDLAIWLGSMTIVLAIIMHVLNRKTEN